MDRHTVVYVLLGLAAGIVVGCLMIFSSIHKPVKLPNPAPLKKAAAERSVQEQELSSEPDHTPPRNIFPTEAEAVTNIKLQRERQRTLDNILAKRTETAIEVRKNVEASINERYTSPVGETRAAGENASASGQPNAEKTLTPAAAQAPDPTLQKIRMEKFKTGEYRIHH
ncbi:MAG: hypothetical protein HQL28_04730 [Candidatus Omnitrophica bacterium]|nr:hypothetical protein [Candidatus Omnitrophota bacterium]